MRLRLLLSLKEVTPNDDGKELRHFLITLPLQHTPDIMAMQVTDDVHRLLNSLKSYLTVDAVDRLLFTKAQPPDLWVTRIRRAYRLVLEVRKLTAPCQRESQTLPDEYIQSFSKDIELSLNIPDRTTLKHRAQGFFHYALEQVKEDERLQPKAVEEWLK